ncbi:hypothetical protein [Alkalimarinus alittae]|uniref:Uncharacterized protein n=1 Tax=Alkalimarinus alittae TaxID=2961619 RepID=A0ABY6N552_9ALTE|nr:hypothetical protein [Alkalimarinus alittae]UZE97248.1 hypothetical protein NKI27_05725 [Alkalimarinus alittae]
MLNNKTLTVKRKRYYTRRLKQCLSCSENLYDFFFHLGYQSLLIPRVVRKLIAKNNLHRAWLSGYTGAGIAKVMEREEWRKPEATDKCFN